MSLAMKRKYTDLLLGYWARLHQWRLAPRESDLDTEILCALIPYICVVERQGQHSLRYQIAGRGVTSRYGRELAGISFRDFWSSYDYEVVERFFVRSGRERMPFSYTSGAFTEDGEWHLFETLWVPVDIEDDERLCFIGVSMSLSEQAGSIVQPPDRLLNIEFLHDGAVPASAAPPKRQDSMHFVSLPSDEECEVRRLPWQQAIPLVFLVSILLWAAMIGAVLYLG